MVFLFFILFMIMMLIIVLVFSKIRIEISNLQFCSQAKKHLNKDYQIVAKLCIFNLIPLAKIKLNNRKLEKIKNIDFAELETNLSVNKELLRSIKRLDISIPKINLKVELGTENASLTAILVPAISTVIAIILRKKVKEFENQIFIMYPIYQNQNLVNLFVSGIFEVKMRHIIDVMYHFMKVEKKGVKKYERTSNRRAYDYSYE